MLQRQLLVNTVSTAWPGKVPCEITTRLLPQRNPPKGGFGQEWG
jgi:hypothetical protein